MKYFVKGIIAIYIASNIISANSINTIDLVLLFVLFAATFAFDTKIKRAQPYIMLAEIIIAILIGLYTSYIEEALMLILFDIFCYSLYYYLIALVGLFLLFKGYYFSFDILFGMVVSGCVGYTISYNTTQRQKYVAALDEERRTKYQLEITKADLLRSNVELEKLTQVKERNRIARDLHDNIGHKIAGVLISLQAANKLLDKDVKKGQQVLDDCIEHLQCSLTTIRDTAHNMYSEDVLGINSLKAIIDNFKFCEINFETEGLVSDCPQRVLLTFSYILKEALTNISKHSNATMADVKLSCLDSIAIMEINDNGIGCDSIRESLGIKSMRDRMRAIGGTLQVNGIDGMRVIGIVPYSEG